MHDKGSWKTLKNCVQVPYVRFDWQLLATWALRFLGGGPIVELDDQAYIAW